MNCSSLHSYNDLRCIVGIRWLISDHSCFQARFRYIKQAICDSEDKLELFLSLDFECCLRARANRKADIISDPEH